MMNKKILFLSGILVLVLAAQAQAALLVNGKDIDDGAEITLFADDLEGAKMSCAIPASGVKKSEISLDKGRTWLVMKLEDDKLVGEFRPGSDDIFYPQLIVTDDNGTTRTVNTNIVINYIKNTPDQQVLLLLDKMQAAYEQENKDRFLQLFSMNFPDRTKFIESIQNDFYNYNNIRLRSRVDNRIFDPDYQGAICSVRWERKYSDRDNEDFSDSANVTMRFEKEGGQWLISGLRDNTIFGSSLLVPAPTVDEPETLVKPDLTVSSSDITLTNLGGNRIGIAVNLRNTGDNAANNVTVKYYKQITDGAEVTPDADYVDTGLDQVVGTVAANSSADVPAVQYDGTGPYLYSIKVVIDPVDTIDEDSETNNSAVKTIDLRPM